MEEKIVKVTIKDIAQSASKVRLVADSVRGINAKIALDNLSLMNKKAALTVKKAIVAGVASARDLYNVDKDNLVVSSISVDEAKTAKRVRFASRGRVSRINKRRAHLNLELKVK